MPVIGKISCAGKSRGEAADAIAKAYETVKTVNFANAYYRNDIGKKAMEV